jgi:hypothetical protein
MYNKLMRRAVYLDFSTPLFESESQLKEFFSSLTELSRYIQKTKNIKFYISITLDFITASKKSGEDLIKVLNYLYKEDRVELVVKDNFDVYSTSLSQECFEFNAILNEYLLGFYFGSKKNFEGDNSVMVKNLVSYLPYNGKLVLNDLEKLSQLNYRNIFVDSQYIKGTSFISNNTNFTCLDTKFKALFGTFISKESLDGYLTSEIGKSYLVYYVNCFDIFIQNPQEYSVNMSNVLHLMDLTDSVEYRFAEESFDMPVYKDLNTLTSLSDTYESQYSSKELYEVQKALSKLVDLKDSSTIDLAVADELRSVALWESTTSEVVNDYLRYNFILLSLLSHSIDAKLDLLNLATKTNVSSLLKELDVYSKDSEKLKSVIESYSSFINQK